MKKLCCLIILSLNVFVVAESQMPLLKDVFKDDFKIGAAVSRNVSDGNDLKAIQLLKQQFNSVTAENVMKFSMIHPEEKRFNFKAADKLVDIAMDSEMQVHGHTFVWHNQTPKWVFEDGNGKDVSREVLLNRMKEHIKVLGARYKGKVFSWDVVNEAFNDDGTLRDSPWKRIIGDDYIEMAFRFADKYVPDAKLYYNDYGMTGKGKRDATIKLVKDLRSKGVRIDGVGMQGHWNLYSPRIDQIELSLKAFTELGVMIHISELDVDVLPWTTISEGEVKQVDNQKKYDPYRGGLPADINIRLSERYSEIFSLFLKYKDSVGKVTFWGISDGYSWKNDFPVRGRVNYPLLFDRSYEPKDAFRSVIGLKAGV